MNGAGPFTLCRTKVSHAKFVQQWAPMYAYPLENNYDEHIGKDLSPDRIRALFEWKNGGILSGRKKDSVERNYVKRREELDALDPSTTAAAFLQRFAEGGAIWRIFWLHLWKPNLYPIYDQHVHRAMTWVQDRRPREIPRSDADKVSAYVNIYLRFYSDFSDINQREVDKALWACGKALKALAGAPIR